MSAKMKRREFITLLGGAAAWPLAARAQQLERVRRIGFVTVVSPQAFSGLYAGFLQGMRELGHVEGRDFITEVRSSEGEPSRLPDLAAELVRLKVDVIVTGSTAAMRPLKQATTTIPIVMAYSTDPVGNGLVPSLARPGANVTGLAGSSDDTAPKQVELLATVVPNVSHIGILGNPTNLTYSPVRRSAQEAANKSGIAIFATEARNPQEIETAFASFGKERVQAVLVTGDPVFFSRRQQITELALQGRLPSMFVQREYPEAGGLMSYGESLSEFYRRAANYVDKIFKGAKPADLPIEQPTLFKLVINRKTADALGVTIPPQLYIFADEVIE
jgi:putative tryptophan/tyrosine transport system substrate-binding protein